MADLKRSESEDWITDFEFTKAAEICVGERLSNCHARLQAIGDLLRMPPVHSPLSVLTVRYKRPTLMPGQRKWQQPLNQSHKIAFNVAAATEVTAYEASGCLLPQNTAGERGIVNTHKVRTFRTEGGTISKAKGKAPQPPNCSGISPKADSNGKEDSSKEQEKLTASELQWKTDALATFLASMECQKDNSKKADAFFSASSPVEKEASQSLFNAHELVQEGAGKLTEADLTGQSTVALETPPVAPKKPPRLKKPCVEVAEMAIPGPFDEKRNSTPRGYCSQRQKLPVTSHQSAKSACEHRGNPSFPADVRASLVKNMLFHSASRKTKEN